MRISCMLVFEEYMGWVALLLCLPAYVSPLLQTGSYDLTAEGMKTFKGKTPSRYSYLVGHENPYYLDGEDRRGT